MPSRRIDDQISPTGSRSEASRSHSAGGRTGKPAKAGTRRVMDI
jgi:hypothetical protein